MLHPKGDNLESLDFVLIGAGNLGTSVTLALNQVGVHPRQIINRTISKAKNLAEMTNCSIYSSNLNAIEPCDFVLVATTDDSIPDIVKALSPVNIPVFHTSGSTDISIFPSAIPNNGVFYPLQSFSAERELDFQEMPLLLEASNDKTLKLLFKIAHRLSSRVIEVSSENRIKTHIAAVLANNFSNHFLILARDYLKKYNIPEDILDPLVKETFNKYIELRNKNAQTGPAVREDMKILDKHKEILKNDPALQKIYNFVSDSIIKYRKEKN
jgi:predicted short-subunit dehydrogenase-like oxidoreductase (DUF2520 family)